MRAVMPEVPQALLDDRREKGPDRCDEMWEGELHMVPAPTDRHQAVGSDLVLLLAPAAKACGLLVRHPPSGLFRPGVGDDWWIPDQVAAETVDRPLRLTWDGGTADI